MVARLCIVVVVAYQRNSSNLGSRTIFGEQSETSLTWLGLGVAPEESSKDTNRRLDF